MKENKRIMKEPDMDKSSIHCRNWEGEARSVSSEEFETGAVMRDELNPSPKIFTISLGSFGPPRRHRPLNKS
jgi:hypothetical protein|tara:strand:+ start:8513 stop:8728 length:216 start_codon:yes stop_codon:yes gene_type:complete